MAVVPFEFSDILESNALGYIATLGPTGAPHVSPVWFVWDGVELRFSTTKDRQKYKNMLREPRVAMAITDIGNPYRSLELRGSVRFEEDPERLYPHVVSQKYTGKNAAPAAIPPEQQRVIGIFTPQKVLVFAP